MPNIKSAMKRVRTSERDHKRNRAVKSEIQSRRHRVLKTLADDAASADADFRSYCSVLDKAVKKGMVARNTANRRKQRMACKLNAARKTA